MQAAWGPLETLWTVGALGTMTDGQLLEHFRAHRDASGQEAFRILVERHGPMVLGRCRSLVSDPHDAEDAFQATFLVLVRRADSIRRRETIGPWLYGVAGRVARRARARSARRRKREVATAVEVPGPDGPAPDSPSNESIIHEEIARLPESLRAPVILCCLEGLSYDLAARRLGVSESTLRGRLHRARRRLATRLRRRGILAPVAARLIEPAGLKVPPLPWSLVQSTVQLASRWSVVGGLLAGASAVPESIAALAQGVLHAMILQTIKSSGVAVLLAAGVLGTVVAQQGERAGGKPDGAPAAPSQAKLSVTAELEYAKRLDVDLKTQQILRKLDQRIDVDPAKVRTLDQLLKHIKQSTTDATFPGIPIYVNPIGLREAPRPGLESEVGLKVKQQPVRRVLEEALRSLGLSYIVKDGFLMVDSRTGITEMRVEALERKLDKVLEALGRLERAK